MPDRLTVPPTPPYFPKLLFIFNIIKEIPCKYIIESNKIFNVVPTVNQVIQSHWMSRRVSRDVAEESINILNPDVITERQVEQTIKKSKIYKITSQLIKCKLVIRILLGNQNTIGSARHSPQVVVFLASSFRFPILFESESVLDCSTISDSRTADDSPQIRRYLLIVKSRITHPEGV